MPTEQNYGLSISEHSILKAPKPASEARPLISLVVYGRNDQHGYNAHRRVALSLNAMAEVLTRPDDEIIFVDYNTPSGMPTLPEAIEDTLTDRALKVLRILRVTPDVHEAVIGDRSAHPISEPHARNAAIRRANPGNWILSTNTDMVFVPKEGRSLSALLTDLPGDAYGLPRFEIPEWLWESVPRTEPWQMMSLLEEWSDRIGLDEVTLGHDWILYDAPGDFQLLRRSLVEEIYGFDEEMIHGWHVDSNLWKRVHNRLGEIGTVYPQVFGYHTNHNRTLTRWTGTSSSGNDLVRFVYGATHSALPEQAESWGLIEFDLPEVRLARANPLPWLHAASARADGQDAPAIVSDSREQRTVLEYDARHVLPFILDPILVTQPRPVVGYVGINDSTRDMLGKALAEIFPPVELLVGGDATRKADVLVVDLGVDVSTGREPLTRREAQGLIAAWSGSYETLPSASSPSTVVIVNGMSGVWASQVRSRFEQPRGTLHSRSQTTRAAQREAGSARPRGPERLLRFLARDRNSHIEIIADETPLECDLRTTFRGLGRGWDLPDENGVYLGGGVNFVRVRARAAQPSVIRTTLVFSVADVPECPMPLELEYAWGPARPRRRTLPVSGATTVVALPALQLGPCGEVLKLSLVPGDGSSYTSTFRHGCHPPVQLTRIAFHRVRPRGLRVFDAAEGPAHDDLFVSGWAQPECNGRWSVDRRATLEWITATELDADMFLAIMGNRLHPDQTLALTLNGHPLAVLQEDPDQRLLAFPLPMAIHEHRNVSLSIECDPPLNPSLLGYEDGRRALAFFLSGIEFVPADTLRADDMQPHQKSRGLTGVRSSGVGI